MEQKQSNQQKGLRNAFWIVLGLFAVLATIFGIALGTLLGNKNKNLVEIVPGPMRDLAVLLAPPTPDPFVKALATDVDYYETGEIQEIPIYEQKKIDKFIFSFLVVVQNGKTDAEDRQTDMIFIVSWNPLQQKFTVVSLPRDTLVPIADYGWKHLNAAYSLGGIGLLVNTINETYGLDLQNYVYIGTEELATLADGVNGIPALLTEGEAAYLNEKLGCALQAGQQQLTGEQVIALLLDRTSDNKGDLGRAGRQLSIIETTYTYMRDNFDSSFMWPFFGMVSKGIRSNVSFEDLTTVGYEIIESDELTLKLVILPYEDSYTEMTYDGSYAILPEFEKNRILIRQELYGIED
ncbi:MAG: LCP family protein [Clostridia bacterium]|nr:LCP family protein [Clostridia bacterium]